MRTWPIVVRRVYGRSMEPTLNPGKIVVGWVWFGNVHVDDVVIIRHEGKELIKRIQKINQKTLFVVGDNPTASTDSRHFGYIATTSVIAKIIAP